jgi:hypothetical protein
MPSLRSERITSVVTDPLRSSADNLPAAHWCPAELDEERLYFAGRERRPLKARESAREHGIKILEGGGDPDPLYSMSIDLPPQVFQCGAPRTGNGKFSGVTQLVDEGHAGVYWLDRVMTRVQTHYIHHTRAATRQTDAR